MRTGQCAWVEHYQIMEKNSSVTCTLQLDMSLSFWRLALLKIYRIIYHVQKS